MPCRVCGRGLQRRAAYNFSHGVVLEPACWRCKVWVSTGGYLMPERRN